MVIRGRVENGVLVLAGDVSLPEGTEVTVVVDAAPAGGATPSGGAVRRPATTGGAVGRPATTGAEGADGSVGSPATTPAERMSPDQRERMRAAIEEILAIPDENPADTFSGADHD